MNLLFDSWCSQVLYQQAPPASPTYPTGYPTGCGPGTHAPTPTGMRLNTLLGAIKSFGLSSNQLWNVSYTTPPITSAQLSGVGVYVSLTHYKNSSAVSGQGFAYSTAELDCIQTWVESGGNVLLMTDHGDFHRPVGSDNWTENDIPLAALFGVTLENYSVRNQPNTQNPSNVIAIQNTIPYLAYQAPTMTAHDACIISPNTGVSVQEIAVFPSTWQAYSSTTNKITPPPTPYFCVVVPYNATGAGSLLVIGNSGWVGDYGSPCPACGLAPQASNLQFVLNCIGYLGGLTDMPEAGQCPQSSPPTPQPC